MNQAFDVWYRAEHARILGACVALSGDVGAAQEATDEAFARALGRWDRVREMSSPGAWVQTVALNCLRRTLRRRRRETLFQHRRPPPPAEAPLDDPEVWAAVRALPERQRLAVVFEDCMSHVPQCNWIVGLEGGYLSVIASPSRSSVSVGQARGGVAGSLDGGRTWAQPVPGGDTGATQITFLNPLHGWAIVDRQCWATGNGGKTWNPLPLSTATR